MTLPTPTDYWISPSALIIQLNALGDPNFIHANCVSGAKVMCFLKDIPGLSYDNGHNYRRWSVTASPSVFPDDLPKYVHIRIPRSSAANDAAEIVFPSSILDIYGQDASGNQLGSTDYYYIFTKGVISASSVDGVIQNRTWTTVIDTGSLATDQAISEASSSWWTYDISSDTITFIKTIASATFTALSAATARISRLILNGSELDGVASDDTPESSSTTLLTPAQASKRFLSSQHDDSAAGNISFEQNISVKGDATARSFTTPDFSAGMEDGSGGGIYRDEYGRIHIQADYLEARVKLRANEMEVNHVSHVAGDQVHTCAGNKLAAVSPLYEDGTTSPVKFYMDAEGMLIADSEAWLADDLSNFSSIIGFRCYFLAEDGTDEVENMWQLGDQAYCRSSNIKALGSSGPYETRRYWRLVIGRGAQWLADGRKYNYVDLADSLEVYIGDTLCIGYDPTNTNDTPKAEDSIVQLGSQTDTDRQFCKWLYVSEAREAIYTGINTFDDLEQFRFYNVSPSLIEMQADKFQWTAGAKHEYRESPVLLLGDWYTGLQAYHWIQVSHNGSQWLCILPIGEYSTAEPSTDDSVWMEVVSKGQDTVSLELTTDNGTIFRNGVGSTTITATVKRGTTDITASLNPNLFVWSRASTDTEGDTAWNARHEQVGNVITITSDDVYVKAQFSCEYTGDL